ncbi:ribonuclease E/G [Caulobacter sp. 17J80-11]|uniref:Rne/Rng family ribonuclease n=1 Tax=Caulobacter sp. 17J80-11 TaxID=2763502 RepID=UPI001653A0C0|nr:ribonuclease E/G [Caulobacter sp. 17J80-11]MBC6983238.1 Rne/Rng family ribonuclease [Caulobacter sp. 17J80-11]
MPKNMLIDAAHAEETRVAVVDGPRVEEFDFESRAKKQLRGNIYLAKVTRVEPSLQAAFIEYGGNRHGFLAFNEIHPDYFQIPVADREALMAEADDEDDDLEAGGEDEDEELPAEEARLRRRMMKRYKIQEVIKRRQVLLVQVVKEERGNKGAALTTYLSLAGRYGVLMPNTARGGGISRKITQATDRKRLKTVVQSLEVPQGMGLIVRTAGAARTKAEIKRDYDYLLRVWENIRETTLHSIAPALIYEEESLVRRAIRDMYDKDIDAVLVEGDEAYKEARDFMRMLMPSQAKKVQHYREPTPLFVKERVEDVLAQIYSPVVPLKSGGYLVINQTEALVAVDVNSGRATKERNIEATALKTNLEAADEAARQLRLRDLAGLIVIDFIDMEESKNNRAVEKRLKDALKDDRARIQMGKISPFGLMEISRQRRRTGVLEGTTHVCEHCQGAGRVRSAESAALQALRAVEIESVRGGAGAITLRLPAAVALYVLNEKRAFLMRLHQTQGLFVSVVVDDNLAHAEHAIERTETSERPPALIEAAPVRQLYEAPEIEEVEEEEEEDETEDEAEAEAEAEGEERAAAAVSGEAEGRRGRRRRRRRGGRREEFEARGPRLVEAEAEAGEEDEGEEEEEGEAVAGEHEDEDGRRRRRRRGRRGGRRMREEGRTRDPYTWTRARTPSLEDPYVWFDPLERQEAREAPAPVERERERERQPRREPVLTVVETSAPAVVEKAAEPIEAAPEPVAEEAPTKRRRVRRKAAAPVATEAAPEALVAEVEVETVEAVAEPAAQPVEEPVVLAHFQPVVLETPPTTIEPVAAPEPDPHQISAPPATPKRGWWRGRG